MIKTYIEGNGIFGIVGNEFIKDENISNEVISIYAVMRTMLFDVNKSCSIMNMQTLYDLVSASGTKPTEKVKDAIEWLIKNQYIEIYDMLYNPVEFNSKSQAMFRVSFLMEDESNTFVADGGFTKIPEFNMCQLLSYVRNNKGIKKYQLIRYYLVIARQCSNDANFGYISMNRLGEIIGVSETTCTDWNNVLKKLEVIDFNNEYGHIRNNVFKMDCTMFGHYNVVNQQGDILLTHLFNDLVENKAKETKLIKVDKQKIANKKSIAQKKIWDERKANDILVEEVKTTKKPINIQEVASNMNKKEKQLHTVEFIKDWANSIIDNINSYQFTDRRFLDELSRLMNGTGFNTISIEDANKTYSHMRMWVHTNNMVIDEFEDLPF